MRGLPLQISRILTMTGVGTRRSQQSKRVSGRNGLGASPEAGRKPQAAPVPRIPQTQATKASPRHRGSQFSTIRRNPVAGLTSEAEIHGGLRSPPPTGPGSPYGAPRRNPPARSRTQQAGRQAGNRALDYSSLARFPWLPFPPLAFASLLWLVPFYLFSLSPPPPPPVLPSPVADVW